MNKNLEMIQRLLSLSENNDNVNEAAAALKRAQKLMEKYRISEAMIDSHTTEQVEEVENDVLHSSTGLRLAWWKRTLARALADVNGCTTYADKNRLDKRSLIMVVGAPGDAATVRYMYNYVSNEIDRLTAAASEDRGRPGKTWCNSFRTGAVEVIRDRLVEAHKEARSEAVACAGNDSVALVKVSNAIANLDAKRAVSESWTKNNLRLVTQNTRRAIDPLAKKAGRRAGNEINLSSGGNQLGSGTRGYLPS